MMENPYHTESNNKSRTQFKDWFTGTGIRWQLLALQLTVLVALSLIIVFLDGDRKLAGLLYDTKNGFYMRHYPLWVWLYEYGTIPGAVLTLASLVGWGGSFWFRPLKQWRRPCLVVTLTAVIAAGFIVNAVLKQYWGRPRPNQTIEFGGYWNYQHVFPPGPPGKGSSFPCGHCAMGFVFLSLWGCRRQSMPLAVGGAIAGIGLGGLLSATRIIQGAHFLSDTVWSLGLVVMTATVLHDTLVRRTAKPPDPRVTKPKTWALVVTVAALALITLGYLTRRPYFDTSRYPLFLKNKVQTIDVHFNADPVRLKILYSDQPLAWVQVDIRGLGWINADTRVIQQVSTTGTTMVLNLDMTQRSYFDELDHTLILILPPWAKDTVAILFNGSPPPDRKAP